jgi:hypothetical protein
MAALYAPAAFRERHHDSSLHRRRADTDVHRRNRSGAGGSRREDTGRSAATIDRSDTREATPGTSGRGLSYCGRCQAEFRGRRILHGTLATHMPSPQQSARLSTRKKVFASLRDFATKRVPSREVHADDNAAEVAGVGVRAVAGMQPLTEFLTCVREAEPAVSGGAVRAPDGAFSTVSQSAHPESDGRAA